MNVSLTKELETYVGKKVHSGLYHSASEVLRESLRLLRERDAAQKYRLEELRRDVRLGLNQLDRGERAPLDMEAIKARVHQGVRKHGTR
jgi:antitoxin ParD1/3/4